ncbi:MAG: DUF4248 domain-containing protein [Bacteroidales bacterium]|nr:DUF4248 domain-containing protein [Bacteroidales bacterium]
MSRYDYDMEIVPMRKQELAMLYAPDLSPRAAVNRLMRWVGMHPTLTAELLKTGYQKRSRLLSARQVELIVEHLGEP